MIRDVSEAADVSVQSFVCEVPERGVYSHFPPRTPVGVAQGTSSDNERLGFIRKILASKTDCSGLNGLIWIQHRKRLRYVLLLSIYNRYFALVGGENTSMQKHLSPTGVCDLRGVCRPMQCCRQGSVVAAYITVNCCVKACLRRIDFAFIQGE